MADTVETFSWGELLRYLTRSQVQNVNTWLPGKVVSWQKDEQRATIDIMILDSPPYPQLQNVPVIFVGPYWDLQADDTGIVLFCVKDFSGFWRQNISSAPEDRGTHQISYAVFLPGLKTKLTPRTVPSNGTVLLKEGTGPIYMSVPTAAVSMLRGSVFLSGLNTFLNALSVYLAAQIVWVNAAAGFFPVLAPAAATFVAAIGVFQAAIGAFQAAFPNYVTTDILVP